MVSEMEQSVYNDLGASGFFNLEIVILLCGCVNVLHDHCATYPRDYGFCAESGW